MARRASSILKLLWPKPRASRSTISAACLNAASFAAWPASAASARGVAPRLVRDTAQRQARSFDAAVRELEPCCDRHQRKRVGQAVADFQVGVVAGKAGGRQLNRHDDLARIEIGIALRRVAWQAVKLIDRNRARPVRAGNMYLGLKQRQSDAHVGGMHRDTGVARAEDRVHAVVALERATAAARRTFVARQSDVVEVGTARALQEIAAGARHIAQLLRGAGADCARQNRITRLHQRVIGEVGIAHQGADAQPAFGRVLDLVQRKPRDVDQLARLFDVHLHQVDQIGPAGNELCGRIIGDETDSVSDAVRPDILEIDHDCPIACWIAATMFV